MVHRIHVAERHIEAGQRKSPVDCPIALAIKDAVDSGSSAVRIVRSQKEIIGRRVEIWIDNKSYFTHAQFEVEYFVEDFDRGYPVAPLRFKIKQKLMVHQKGWRVKHNNKGEMLIFGWPGLTACGKEVEKTTIMQSKFISFPPTGAAFFQIYKMRVQLFWFTEILSVSQEPQWAEYCEKCFCKNPPYSPWETAVTSRKRIPNKTLRNFRYW